MKRIPFTARAGVMLGIVAWLAAIPLLAQGMAQLSAAFTVMPASLHASLSGINGIRSSERSRADIQSHVTKDDRAGRVSRIRVSRDARGPRFATRLAAIDPQRYSAPAPAVQQLPPSARLAWISDHPVMGAELRPADSALVSMAGLDQRLGVVSPPASLGRIAAPVMIAEVLPQAEEQTGASSSTQARVDDTAAGADNSSVPLTPAMVAALPKPRPAHSADKGQESHSALAYAAPDEPVEDKTSGRVFGRLFGGHGSLRLPGPDSKVAVYDIGAATVYMPNGEKLEAHSGLAHMKDNPRYVTEKMRGPTPPNLYNLRMRERRFHGVEAIRLLPADGKKKFNRDGLLAHTYMYVGGGNDRSQSNGCVVFKDYNRFLAAFKRGEIERLIVVPSMDELPTYMAAL